MAQDTTDTETMPSGEEIFAEALSKGNEQTENTPTEPTEAPVEAKEGRVRDDKGRFVPKAPEATSEVVEATPEQPPVETKPEDKTPERIPLAEYLSEREKRQNEQRQREQLQQELMQLRQQLQVKQAPSPEPVDIFADPQKWEQSFEQRMEQKFREVVGNVSLQRASDKHGEKFTEAWKAMVERSNSGDDSIRQSIINSPDPGDALVRWYKREETLKLVGDEPAKYAEKILNEALDNPEFLARAIEKARGKAADQPTQVHLPPSLNKGSAAPSRANSGTDASDEGIWQSVWQR